MALAERCLKENVVAQDLLSDSLPALDRKHFNFSVVTGRVKWYGFKLSILKEEIA